METLRKSTHRFYCLAYDLEVAMEQERTPAEIYKMVKELMDSLQDIKRQVVETLPT